MGIWRRAGEGSGSDDQWVTVRVGDYRYADRFAEDSEDQQTVGPRAIRSEEITTPDLGTILGVLSLTIDAEKKSPEERRADAEKSGKGPGGGGKRGPEAHSAPPCWDKRAKLQIITIIIELLPDR